MHQVDWPLRNMLPYFSAHIFGGSTKEFLLLIRTLARNTEIDSSKGRVPLVHDESYLNWYWRQIGHQPTVTLSRAFKWPDTQKMCKSAIVANGYVMEKTMAEKYCKELQPFIVETAMRGTALKQEARSEGIDDGPQVAMRGAATERRRN